MTSPCHLLSSYDFHLPKERIALAPARRRDESRLLFLHAGSLRHGRFRDIVAFLPKDALLVLNDTEVLPATVEVLVKGSGRAVDLTFHQKISDVCWKAFAKPGKALSPGTELRCGAYLLTVVEKNGAEIVLETTEGEGGFPGLFAACGQMPLPPYIKEARRRSGMAAHTEEDRERYRTVYAVEEGSVAAPTAGLHFTAPLLEEIRRKGCTVVSVTLHVGAGTFLPVKEEDVARHPMHEERFRISDAAARAVTEAKREGRPVVCVGTTSLRALESAWSRTEQRVVPGEAGTRLFITPGYGFRVADALLTNFHLPKSTLLMLVSAFYGRHAIRSAYERASLEGYRFFSYGDACLIVNPLSLHKFPYA
jgi:S-adenosylmethionine:tRNA ribosyltransferase-isomerase